MPIPPMQIPFFQKMQFLSIERLSDQDFRQMNFELVIFQWTVISFSPGEVHPIGLGGERFFDHPVY